MDNKLCISMYHFEFDDVDDLDKVMVKIKLPKLNNARWIPNIAYYLTGKVTIKVLVKDHRIDKCVYFPEHFHIFNELLNRNTVNDYPSSEGSIIFYPLFPDNMRERWRYMKDVCIPYKIICDIETNPKLESLCIPSFEKATPETEGDIVIDVFIEKEKDDDIIDNINDYDILPIYI